MFSSYKFCTINEGFNEAGEELMEVNDENTGSLVSLTNMQSDMLTTVDTTAVLDKMETGQSLLQLHWVSLEENTAVTE